MSLFILDSRKIIVCHNVQVFLLPSGRSDSNSPIVLLFLAQLDKEKKKKS